MVSGNDSAVALAEFIGGDIDNFSSMMNQKASSLGLTSSYFVTPHGLDQDDHYTTAFELAKIANYALKNDTFSKIVRTSNYTITINNQPKNLHNTNELLGSLDGVYGVKTGFTNGANRCLVTACKRGNLDIICVVLGCDTKKNRTQDSINLINYTFNNFSVVNVKNIIDKNFDNWVTYETNKITVTKGMSSNLKFCLNESQIKFNNIALNNSCLDRIHVSFSLPDNLNAPLLPNSVVGYLTVNINGDDAFSVDILNTNLVRKKNIFYYLNTFSRDYFSYCYNS